jgi:hypothetical protein
MGCALLALWSCGLDDSAVVQIDDTDAAQPDASSIDGATDSSLSDSGSTDTGVLDTGVDSGPCPVSDLPICDNGTCGSTSEVCTPPIPVGWHLTNLINASSGCDSTYGGDAGAKSVVEITDGGPASCACNCTSTGDPSCANVHVDMAVGSGATCNVATDPLDMTAGCSALGLTLTANSQATVSVATNATCSGSVAPSIPTIDGGLATTCDLNTDAGEICATHRACVPKPSTGHTCIAQAGAVACPTGFTVFTATVASSYTDTRNCSACSCAFNGSGCNNPIVDLYPSLGCSGTGTTVSQSTCSNNGAGLSVGVTGTNVNPCVQNDGGVLDGGTAVVAPETVCCSN